MTDTPQPRADDDAERLAKLSKLYRASKLDTEERTDCIGHVLFLLRLLDSRDAALREAQQEVANLTHDIERALDGISGEAAEVDRLEAALREAREQIAAAERSLALYAKDVREAREEVKRLREALTPFAMLGGSPDMRAYHDLEDDVVIYKNSGYGITAGDVRNARRVLGPTSEMHFRRSQPATSSPVPPPQIGRTLEQQAWEIVHNHGPTWWNLYTRQHPNSKVSEQRLRESMAHYCVVAALREMSPAPSDAALREAREDRDRAWADNKNLRTTNDRLIELLELALARPRPATPSPVPPSDVRETLDTLEALTRAARAALDHPEIDSAQATLRGFVQRAERALGSRSPSDAATDGGRPEARRWRPIKGGDSGVFPNAGLVEQADTEGLNPSAQGHDGSSPSSGTSDNSAAKASAEDVERARTIVREYLGEQFFAPTTHALDRDIAAAFVEIRTAARAEGERAGIERAIQAIELEAKHWPAVDDVQWPMEALARAVRALLPAAPERK